MPADKQRILWLDCAKGFVTISVILGHFVQNSVPSLQFAHHIIYSFHMGAFFIISGWFCSAPKPGQTFFAAVKRRAVSLLVPYWAFAALILLQNLRLNDYDLVSLPLFQPKILVQTFFMMRVDSYFSTLWFLPALFSAQLIFWLLQRYVRHPAALFFAALGVSMLGYAYSGSPLPKLPLNAEIGAMAVVLLCIGSLVRTLPDRVWCHPAGIVGSACLFFGLNYYSYFVLCDNSDAFYYPLFAHPLISVFTVLTGTYLLLALGHLNFRWLLPIGQNSLYLYGFHYLLLGPLIRFGYRLSFLTTTVHYAVWVVLQTVVTVVVCTALSLLLHRIKRRNFAEALPPR